MFSALVFALLLGQAAAADLEAADDGLLKVAFPSYDPETRRVGSLSVERTDSIDLDDGIVVLMASLANKPEGSSSPYPAASKTWLIVLKRQDKGLVVLDKTSLELPGGEVSLAPFTIGGGSVAIKVHTGRASDGEESRFADWFFGFNGHSLTQLFSMTWGNSGDGYPSASQMAELVVCRSRTNGVNDVDIDTRSEGCDEPTEASPEPPCQRVETVDHYTWNGAAFDQETVKKACSPVPVAKPPPYLLSVTASSTLHEKSLPADYYDPSRAADGLAETAWAEGRPGAGIGEWVLLTLRTPLALRAIRLMPGCGTTARLWVANERLKAVRLTFSDGKTQEIALADSAYGRFQEVPIERVEPTGSLKIEVREVFQAKFQDACVSEVELVPR